MKLGCTNISGLYKLSWQATECCPFLLLRAPFGGKEKRVGMVMQILF
jgi:hypothetical protein